MVNSLLAIAWYLYHDSPPLILDLKETEAAFSPYRRRNQEGERVYNHNSRFPISFSFSYTFLDCCHLTTLWLAQFWTEENEITSFQMVWNADPTEISGKALTQNSESSPVWAFVVGAENEPPQGHWDTGFPWSWQQQSDAKGVSPKAIISTHSTQEKCRNKRCIWNSLLLLCFLPVFPPWVCRHNLSCFTQFIAQPLLPGPSLCWPTAGGKSKCCPCHSYQMKTLTGSSAIIAQSVNLRL